jgi:hypothetical protein
MSQTPPEDHDPQDEDSSIDPEDEFDVEQELLEELQDQVMTELRHDIEMLEEGSRRNSSLLVFVKPT